MGIAATGLLAGCPSQGSSESNTASADTETTEQDATAGTDDSGESGASVGPMTAVATEWNAYRARLYDAVALGRAGAPGAGATVAQNIFARFEGASGEYGAHEQLESTSESAYEGFEDALGTVQSSLSEGDVSGAASAADEASGHLQTAQQAAAGQQATRVLDLLVLGSRASNAAVAGTLGAFEGAATIAEETMTAFEDALVYSQIEDADAESYEAFENALAGIGSAAGNEDASGVTEQARAALDATVSGAYALVQQEAVAGAGHLATMQARGWDADALASAGGPGHAYAHTVTLNSYRARVADADWLAANDAADAASTAVENVFAHFEGADAHDALEEADDEAYETFEGGLEDLSSAIENGNADGIDSATETVDTNLVTGIEALVGGEDTRAALESGFFRARIADARELYRLGDADSAATIVSDVFARFERDELGFHETMEHESEDLYHRFEEEHLTSLQSAYEDDDSEAVATHHDGVQQALIDFEAALSTPVASGAETDYMIGRAFDAAGLAALSETDRAATVIQDTFAHFERGAAGFHEALEEADEEIYESFEATLTDVRTAAEDGGDVTAAATAFNDEAVAAAYAIAGSAGGNGEAAAAIIQDVFATFEEARVHEMLEDADHDAYENFEAALTDYSQGLTGGDADPAVLADATRTAQFAVVGAVDSAPSGSGGHGGEESEETESSLSGGPNVVEGVPDDADHVVDMETVAFNPEELTVSVGDTVAWKHVGGEAHNVVAYEEELPEDATYWASGGFESESAAREGWENGEGAVQSGQSYVHTFETAGEHGYFCVPHEAAGMAGTVIVEE
ncbi:cytochrome-like protein Fbr [Haloarcula vallismortis ATCC 29715]|uniref:Cytochrome-like protein Fbr n=1 Tax=Haloarcula vallismortis ATCC 29715 TaxID=662477 RepID=M0JV68_HALVA|nr:cytochrome-like protein Fbr [Haloarcula vallismortis ATCC 29715]